MPGLFIRRKPRPVEVAFGPDGVPDRPVVLVNQVTLALRSEVCARLRAAGDGRVDPDAVEREIARAMLAGWRNLRDEDGVEVPFGPCPACAPAPVAGPGGEAPATGPLSVSGPPQAACTASGPCEGCGGSGDCRDWAVRSWPDALWTPIYEAGTRVLREEERQSGN